MNNSKTKKITTIGLLCAMAMVLNLLVSFPLVPAVSFLKFDPKDIIIVIGGFIYGPLTSFVISAICSVLELLFRGGTILDVLMNVIASCTFACTAAFIYKKVHTKNGAVLGLIAGTICCTLSMVLWNYIITPIYFGMPREAVVGMLLPGIVPFNLLKCGINAGITLFVYKPIVTALRHSGLVKESESVSTGKSMAVVGGFMVVSVLLIVCTMNGLL
ncbi:ECF transporter S component [Dubosiella muris]|mgnify:CR=1 FL=1|uniref:ECF transporter S component n=1 Tax=Dubosiella muris TaxID=3038133 RepID=A0AC61R568_9FIRM|nr:ECF transporter S component [Dubosiella muris]TGY64893.1 ECF transporter S component [Dubosiella muris]